MEKIKKEKNKSKIIINIIRIILCILIVIWMCTEFRFSNEVSETSTHTSDKVTMYLIDHNTKTQNLPIEKKQELIEKSTVVVRKSAHFSIYLLGGILLVSLTNTYSKLYKKMGYAWIFCILYAMSDEFHKLFVPGRSGEIRDICIDSLGALLGIIIMTCVISIVKFIICQIMKKRKKNKEKFL